MKHGCLSCIPLGVWPVSRLQTVGMLLLLVASAGCGSSQPSGGTTGGSATGNGKSLYDQIQSARAEPSADRRARRLISLGDQQRKALDRTGANTTLGHAADAVKEVTDPVVKVDVLAYLAKGYARADNRTAAKRAANEAAEVAREIEAPETQATALTTAASGLAAAGETTPATTALADAEKLADELGDVEGQTFVLCEIAKGYHQLEYQVDFDRINAKALEVAQAAEDVRKRSDATATVAAMQKQLDLKQADETFDLSLVSAREVEDPMSQAFALTDIADKLLAVKQRTKAMALLQEAEALADKMKSGSLKTELMSKIYKLRG